MNDDMMPMKQKLLSIVTSIRDSEENINLEETPVLFKWVYEEEPHIEFQLLIKEKDQSQFGFGEMGTSTVH